MITLTQITDSLTKGSFGPEQTRAMGEAFELSQRKTQDEVEMDLKDWFEVRMRELATKEELNGVRLELRDFKSEILKWMFIFWVGQLAAMVAIVKLIK